MIALLSCVYPKIVEVLNEKGQKKSSGISSFTSPAIPQQLCQAYSNEKNNRSAISKLPPCKALACDVKGSNLNK